LQWLEATAHGPDLLCIVIFRGSWCKYDQHYLKKLGQHHKQVMKKDSVKLIAWTSEGREGAKKADEEWGLTKDFGYDGVLGDETNALAKWLIEDEVLPNLVIKPLDEAQVDKSLLPATSTYPNGMVMPGMVWYAHHGNPVFQWEKEFTAPAYGGPGRPDPDDLFQEVLKRKHALDHGNAVMPSHGTNLKMCSNDMDVTLSKCALM